MAKVAGAEVASQTLDTEVRQDVSKRYTQCRAQNAYNGAFRDEEPQRVVVRDRTGAVVANDVLAFDVNSATRLAVGVRVSQLQSDISAP